jgi:hypothetical protein
MESIRGQIKYFVDLFISFLHNNPNTLLVTWFEKNIEKFPPQPICFKISLDKYTNEQFIQICDFIDKNIPNIFNDYACEIPLVNDNEPNTIKITFNYV